MSMKRIYLLGAILVLTSMACATYETFFPGSDNNTDAIEPTSIAILQTNAPIATLGSTNTPIIAPPTSEAMETTAVEEAGATSTLEATADEGGEPSTSNFYTCVGPCLADGSNDQGYFAERSEIIYFQFEFENFPQGASYTRWWTRNGVEWARYQCAWPGPESGLEQITLTEPNGLASGTWQVTITIDGVIVLQETLVVQGTWNYWDPAGFFSACYGKR